MCNSRIQYARGALSTMLACALALSLSLPAHGEAAAPGFTLPVKFKNYQIQYEIAPDLTYTETDDLQITVLTQRGVEMSRQMPIALPDFRTIQMTPNGLKLTGDRNVQIVTAYTLKKSGKQLPGAEIAPQVQPGAPVGASTVPGMKMISFPEAEVDDVLVVSYKITQKQPVPPGNVALEQTFPTFQVYDHAEVSLTAPASLNLRLDVIGVDKAQTSASGQTRKWVWTYHSSAGVPAPEEPSSQPMAPKIHISSFADDLAEREAFAEMTIAASIPELASGQPCVTLPGAPLDGPQGMNTYGNEVAILFASSAKNLGRLADSWNNPSCVMEDGRPRVAALQSGFGAAFGEENDWSASYARIEQLKKVAPAKAFVALAEAKYWEKYAWNARGDGYASSVTQDGWRLFRERLEKAEKTLVDSKAYASEFPLWYADMIAVESLLDRDKEQRNGIFLEGARKHRTYYPLYFTMLTYTLPRWGGSWGAVEELVKWSVENTRDVDGASMYARLYWNVYQWMGPDETLFKSTRATWPKMKKGFDDLMSRHPKSKWNLNNYAMFACLAGDKATFRRLRKKIGKGIMNEAWQNPTLDLCEAKYGR